MIYKINTCILIEASRGAAARGVTVKPTECGFDPHSRRWNIYLNLYFHFFVLVSRLSAALNSATRHAMPPEFGRKWGTECLSTRFPLKKNDLGTIHISCTNEPSTNCLYNIMKKKQKKFRFGTFFISTVVVLWLIYIEWSYNNILSLKTS